MRLALFNSNVNSIHDMKTFIFGLAMVAGLLFAAPQASAQDFCTTVQDLNKLAPTNFKAVQGDLNDAETELEGEDVFNTTTTLPGFENGVILPTFTEGKKKIQFYNYIADEAEANAFLATVQTQLNGCLTQAAGFKAREDSGIFFWESTTLTLQLMRSSDIDDNGDSVFKVLVQLYKR
jgi:hypothetical protein